MYDNTMVSPVKVLCFIPMRNCQSKIGELLAKFRGELLDHVQEIIVVDNASEDGSIDEARKALAAISAVKVTLLQSSRNYGLGGSHKIAFNYALENGYDYLFVVHGDNSADPADFLDFLKRGLTSYEVILSDRLHGDFKRSGYPLYRLLGNRILSGIASALTFFPIKDFGGGPLNIYRVSSFLNRHENAIKTFSNQIEFPQFALLYGIYRRMKITFVPIDFSEVDKKKQTWKLITQFLKPVRLLLNFVLRPRATIAPDLQGAFFGHTFLKVNINSNTTQPPSPKPRKEDPEAMKLLDLRRTMDPSASIQNTSVMDISRFEVVWARMRILPTHLNSDLLYQQINEFLKVLPANRIILDINGDEVVKSKQCYDFLTYCLDRGIEPQLITNAVGDINLWRNYAKLVKNITINYIPGEVQRTFFHDLIREVGPMGNISVNVVTHRDYFYHSVGLKELIETERKCKSVLLQPYFLGAEESLPEDHMDILLDQTAIVHTWRQENIFRRHCVYSLGKALKDEGLYRKALEMGFMEMSAKQISKDKIKILNLSDKEGAIFV